MLHQLTPGSEVCIPIATRLIFLVKVPLRDEFRGRLNRHLPIREFVMSNADSKSGHTTATTGARKFAANDVRTLIANNLRSLVCWCPASQQPVDLQVYADYATLTHIVSNSVRFQCPHCGAEHETKVAATRPEAFWIKPQRTHWTRGLHPATPGQSVNSKSRNVRNWH
jgi:hypothetical protein